MTGKINQQALLECICFSAFSAIMFYLTCSGKYLAYVTPKMAPYLYLTAALTALWALSQVPALFRPRHRLRAAHCLVLAVPILFLLLPHESLGGSGLTSGSLNPGVYAAAPAKASPAAVSQAPTASAAAPQSGYDDTLIKRFGLTQAEDGSVNISDELFYPWLSEIFVNRMRYDGVSITVKGFVYKDPDSMASNEFGAARLLMYCCTADLSPCGILCRYDGASQLEANAWVTITGTVFIGESQGEEQPEILVTSVTPAEKPKDEYVYPL